jgi:ribonuclease-3
MRLWRHGLISRIPFLRSTPKPDTRAHEANVPEQVAAEQIQTIIQYRFNDASLLIQALKHRSYVYEKEQSGVTSYERLEFLGDAVLDLVVSEHLYQLFPKRREGRLTQMRSAMVNKTALAEQARRLNIGAFLLLSEGETRSGGRARGSILSDTYESIIGAMYLDGGIEPARVFLRNTLLTDVDQNGLPYPWHNYKSVLLEFTQSEGKGQPQYRVESELGPDHEKVFTVRVYVAGAPVGSGVGMTKKDAEQNAARDASERLNLIPQEP